MALFPFHANAKGEVEIRRAFQQLRAELERSGGGGANRWRFIWPPLVENDNYSASGGDFILVEAMGSERSMTINLPPISADNDSALVAVKTGLGGRTNPGRIFVIPAVGNGDTISRPAEGEEGIDVFEMTVASPFKDFGKVFVFTASLTAKSWFIYGSWSGP